MHSKVKDTLTQFNMIDQNDYVLVGVSGGADSVALLINLCEYKKIVDFRLEVVHVNHLIREDASEDAKFVEELCKLHGVKYHLFEIEVEQMAEEKHLSTEEAGRIARYSAMRSLNPDKIAVGHHRDDQAETVLLNMCRGTGLHGMKGIAPVTNDIIRPLLFVSRGEIEQYLIEKKQAYRTDSTNLTTEYVRNRLRHNVIPYLNSEINEKSDLHIAEMATDMWELEQFVDGFVAEQFAILCKPTDDTRGYSVDIKGFERLNFFIRRELLLRILAELTPKRKDITRTHINLILALCQACGEKSLDLPYDLQAVKSYDRLIIRKRIEEQKRAINIEITEKECYEGREIRLADGRLLRLKLYEKADDFIIEDNKYTKRLDYDRIKCSLVVRNRAEGDYLTISDAGQKKSLKDYMINEKIPQTERDGILLLADGNHIIWVVGHRISAEYKISESTRTILEISVKETD